LFRAEAGQLARYASRTLPFISETDVEDLVQVTFQAAAVEWEKTLSSLDQDCRNKWLRRVLRNKAIDQWRSPTSRQLPLEQVERTAGPGQETWRAALSLIILRRCWEAIAKMPSMRQQVAFLRWGEEWTCAEIAEWLGIMPATVRSHLKRARDQLAIEIGPDIPFAESDDDSGEGVTW
jgi:RNA polymerase sigma-70 factor (ECF subfamily)